MSKNKKSKMEKILAESKMDLRIEVGVFDDSAGIYDDGDHVTNVAAAHEFGAGVPMRSFLRTTIDENSEEYTKELARRLKRFRTGQNIGPEVKTFSDGLVQDVKNQILKMTSPPLAESTVKRKGHNKLLRETDKLLNSIEARVVDQSADD